MARFGSGDDQAAVIALLWQFVLLLIGTLFLFGALSAAMSLLTRYIGEERLRRWLGGNAFTASIKGLLFGVITPFCSWSSIPILVNLLRSRVRTSAVAAFFLASPVLDPVLIVAMAWLFGVRVAAWFTVFLTVVIVIAAHVAERMQLERLVLDRALAPAASHAAPAGGTDACERRQPAWKGAKKEASDAGRFAATQMRQLLLPLAITCAVAVVIAGVVPQQLITQLAGPTEPYAIPAAAALGVPLYLPTEALAPLGWALRDSGVGVGPIFALMITAASLSLPEFLLLSRLLQLRLIVGLTATITAIAVTGALLVPLIATA